MPALYRPGLANPLRRRVFREDVAARRTILGTG
jgi:hypothetical protein